MVPKVENLSAIQETLVDPWVGKNDWRKEWQLIAIILPGKLHKQKSLDGYSL